MGKKEEVGMTIRVMRKSRGMTQEDLAKAIGQSSSSITMYETGRRSPDFETLEAMADVFNVPLSALLPERRQETEAPEVGPEIRIVSGMMQTLPKEQQEQIVAIVRTFVTNHPNRKDDEDDNET